MVIGDDRHVRNIPLTDVNGLIRVISIVIERRILELLLREESFQDLLIAKRIFSFKVMLFTYTATRHNKAIYSYMKDTVLEKNILTGCWPFEYRSR